MKSLLSWAGNRLYPMSPPQLVIPNQGHTRQTHKPQMYCSRTEPRRSSFLPNNVRPVQSRRWNLDMQTCTCMRRTQTWEKQTSANYKCLSQSFSTCMHSHTNTHPSVEETEGGGQTVQQLHSPENWLLIGFKGKTFIYSKKHLTQTLTLNLRTTREAWLYQFEY